MKHLFLLFLLFPVYACNNKSIDRAVILKKFSKETISFFWETACYEDCEQEIRHADKDFMIKKWAKDIFIRAYGNMSCLDSLGIQTAINELNKLDLPIKAYWLNENDEMNHNYEIHFRSKEEEEKNRSCQIFHDSSLNGSAHMKCNNQAEIEHATVIIVDYKEKDKSTKEYKTYILLHEFLNSLGLIGDSFSSIESVLYDHSCDYDRTHFSEIDQSALSLLYSPAIPFGCTRAAFFESFKEILAPRGITESDYQAFESLIIDRKWTKETLLSFVNSAFHIPMKENETGEAIILKWKTPPIIYFSSATLQEKYYPLLQESVDRINSYLPPSVQIQFAQKKQYFNTLVIDGATHAERLTSAYAQTGRQLVFHYMDDEPLPEEKDVRELAATKKLIELLGVDRQEYYRTKRCLQQECDTSFIRLYLSPVVQSGMNAQRLLDIINKYYDLEQKEVLAYKKLEEQLSRKNLSTAGAKILLEIMNDKTLGEFISQWDSVRLSINSTGKEHLEFVRSICKNLSPIIDIQYVTTNENLQIDVTSQGGLSSESRYSNKQHIYYGTVRIPSVAFHSTNDISKFSTLFYSIFNMDMASKPFIENFDGTNFSVKSDWAEVFKFYFSNTHSGMKKNKIKDLLLKYYPEIQDNKNEKS